MPVPSQPTIDEVKTTLEAAQAKLASIQAELDALKAQTVAGILTDQQASDVKTAIDAIKAELGK